MKKSILFIAALVLLCASCTEHRKDTPPTPNRDTVEVDIQPNPTDSIKIINL